MQHAEAEHLRCVGLPDGAAVDRRRHPALAVGTLERVPSGSLRARFGRAASCTSTQSSSDAPWACSSNSALSTESARSSPPGARWIRGSLAQRRPGQ
ncbi:hypothetical protein WR25_10897 [Diploscapter pachys]|uniref:Uncharacterized protein n=1 Tax=Diploscapter pachys TaxID=2018661 RepID=A0A2A2K278_9BILA|nr:hypothetical protein WR25_10897 [Diploscapter pachys]